MIRLAKIHHPVTALGPGRRVGIWTQGCRIGCAGCVSRDTWPAEAGSPVDVAAVVGWCRSVGADVDGVTISGGEPSEQPGALDELVTGLAGCRDDFGWDILCYTGVEADEFASRCPRADALVDVLVTGPYRAAEPTELIWRGSANQRMVLRTELAERRYRQWVDAAPDRPVIQVAVDDAVRMIGIPRRGDLRTLTSRLAAQGIKLENVSWRP
jgi:anaerobic ribonucleoside-triphosphate reductase activating protein